ncbi:MAG: hypothetical protein H8E68_02250 [Kiritimatiellaeota bacterium]|nr:hypothetical protein [Kiritimatiellota bacterium]
MQYISSKPWKKSDQGFQGLEGRVVGNVGQASSLSAQEKLIHRRQAGSLSHFKNRRAGGAGQIINKIMVDKIMGSPSLKSAN